MNISIVITCYSEGVKLLNAIESVETQKFADFELIIVNDKSLHYNTNLICEQLEQSGYNIIWRPTNGGLSAARNTGISSAIGKIIVPLDADDILPENALNTISKAFSDSNFDFLFGNYSIVGEGGSKVIDTSILCMENNELDPERLARNWILLGTSPFKKQVWVDVAGYDENDVITNSVQDIDFFMRAICLGNKGGYIPEIIYQWNDSYDSMNKNVKSVAYSYLNRKNAAFLTKYRFSEKMTINYVCTMLYADKQYKELLNFMEPFRLRQLNFKNRIKYIFCYVMERGNA